MADVWACNLTKGKPAWNEEKKTMMVPVNVSVTLDIDGAGANEFKATTVSRTENLTADISLLADSMAAEIQTFIDSCKKERTAEKSTKYTNLITGIVAQLTY